MKKIALLVLFSSLAFAQAAKPPVVKHHSAKKTAVGGCSPDSMTGGTTCVAPVKTTTQPGANPTTVYYITPIAAPWTCPTDATPTSWAVCVDKIDRGDGKGYVSMQGATGPAGPQGPPGTGAQGPMGPMGPQGPPGTGTGGCSTGMALTVTNAKLKNGTITGTITCK